MTFGGLAVATVVALLAVAVVVTRRDRLSGRAVVQVTGGAAALGGLVAVGAMVISIMRCFSSGPFAMTVPVSSFWPALNPGVTVEGPTAHVVDGGFTSADVSVSGLQAGTRIIWTLGDIASSAVLLTICVLVALACWQLLRGNPFAPVLSNAAGWAALAVLIGGLLAQILHAVAGVRASEALLQLTTWSSPDVHGQELPTGLPQSDGSWTIVWWPVGLALLLAAFAAMVRYGGVLQRDVDGLI